MCRYIFFLTFTCFAIICIGGLLFSKIRYERCVCFSNSDAYHNLDVGEKSYLFIFEWKRLSIGTMKHILTMHMKACFSSTFSNFALLHLALSLMYFYIFYQANPLHYCFGGESGATKKALMIPFGILGLVFPPRLHTSRCNSDKKDHWIISTCILSMLFFIFICFLVNGVIFLCF